MVIGSINELNKYYNIKGTFLICVICHFKCAVPNCPIYNKI